MEKETLNEIGNALYDFWPSIIGSVNPIAGITTEVIIKAFEAKIAYSLINLRAISNN